MKKRIAADAIPAASRSDAVGFALPEPAIKALRLDLREAARLARRQKFAWRAADRTRHLHRGSNDALALETDDLNPASLYNCNHSC